MLNQTEKLHNNEEHSRQQMYVLPRRDTCMCHLAALTLEEQIRKVTAQSRQITLHPSDEN